MGQVNFTPKQQLVFDEIKNSEFVRQNFYFTGGTALSSIYLNHRLSEDLDFFSEKEFDTLPILNLVTGWGKKHNFNYLTLPMCKVNHVTSFDNRRCYTVN